MKLQQLIAGLGLRVVSGDANVEIERLVDDSRKVTPEPGTAFIARSASGTGTEDGSAFIQDALSRGAAIIIRRDDANVGTLPAGVVDVAGPAVDQALTGELAERLFDRPSRKLTLIGVTGTSGKTTTTFLIQHFLHAIGIKCGVIGTVVLDDGATRTPAELTTPGAIEFSSLLARMVNNGCGAAVAEVSSHALHQGRVGALKFHVGVLTNITGDHLDYHGTMDRYAAAKAILFESLDAHAFAVVNADDAYAERMLQNCRARALLTTLTPGEPGSAEAPAGGRITCRAAIHESLPTGTRTTFTGPWGGVEVKLPLVGRHNVQNTLQAIAAANAAAAVTGSAISRVLRSALETVPQVPGRLERVSSSNNAEPTVLVDYAHKTDALDNVLSALRPLVDNAGGAGKLVCVFGCGGDRDRTKRPKMAAVACKWADRVVITSDNPRTEDPHAIIDEILGGVPPQKRQIVAVEPDRAKAIELAVATAGVNDTVLIAGKGHEDYQIIGKTKRHFDDREHAAEALRRWVQAHRSEEGSWRASA